MTLKRAGSKTTGVALALLLSATSVTFAAGVTNSTDTAPSPSAQSSTQHHAVRTAHRPNTRRLYNYAPSGVEQNGAVPGAAIPGVAVPGAPLQGEAATPGGEPARYAAIHDCSVQASKWSFSTWETTQLAVYRSCMAEYGQAE